GAAPDLYLEMAKLHLREKEWDKAEQALNRAIELAPDSADAHFTLGGFFAAKNATASAEEELKRVVALAPEGTGAHLGLAELYLQSGRPDEARRLLQELVSKNSGF